MTTLNFEPQISVDFSVEGLQVGSYSVPLATSDDPLREHQTPLWVMRQGEGPVVCVVSGMQSGDVTGTTVLQSLLKTLDIKHIKGTLILCPAFVPAAAEHGLTTDQYEYIKHAFADDVLAAADIIIEIGSAAACIVNAPHVSVWPSADAEKNTISEDIMIACGAPDSVRRFDPTHPNSLAAIAEQNNTAFVRIDLGRYGSTDKMSRLMGVSELRNALLHIGVLSEGHFDLNSTRILEVSKPQCRINAPTSGLVHWHVEIGGAVHMGNPIAEIVDPQLPFSDPVVIDARMNGVLLSKLDSALCNPGQWLAILGDEVPR